MRILQVHTRYRNPGGEDVVVEAEARVLREAGHQVRQVIERNPDGATHAAASLLLSPWNPLAMRRIAKYVAEFHPDVAHIHNTWFAMSPAVIRTLKKAGVPVVMTLHNYRLTCVNGLLYRDGAPCELCVGTHPWHGVQYGCYRGSRAQSIPAAATISLHQRLGTWAEQVNTFIALTDFQRDLMVRAGLPRDKLVVKPNFVQDPGPRPAPPSQSQTVLFVGRLAAEKGVDTLVEAWRQADAPGLELLVIGDGPMRRDLEAKSPTGIRFLGSKTRAEVLDLMLNARIGIMPSRWYEGLPLVLLEFMAAGTGVVGSSHGALGTLIRNAWPEWAVPSDAYALARAIETVSSDDLCDTQGARSRALYKRTFSATSAAKSLTSIYTAANRGTP